MIFLCRSVYFILFLAILGGVKTLVKSLPFSCKPVRKSCGFHKIPRVFTNSMKIFLAKNSVKTSHANYLLPGNGSCSFHMSYIIFMPQGILDMSPTVSENVRHILFLSAFLF